MCRSFDVGLAPLLADVYAGLMKRALLVAGGDAPPASAILKRLPDIGFVCAADSGLDTLAAWGLRADLAVGDFDSLADPGLLAACPEVMRHPAAKDDTDTELGLAELRRRGWESVMLAGGGGGRLDHILAIRALFERPDSPDEWLTAFERVVLLRETREFSCAPGSTVSVFPLAGGSSGMGSEGLAWPLEGLVWDAGHFGLSNVASNGRFSITPGSAPLLVIMPQNAEDAQ